MGILVVLLLHMHGKMLVCAQNCRGSPGHLVHSRAPRIQAELPSVPGLADAGLGLTEGALPGSADTEPTSSKAAAPKVEKGQIAVKEERLPNSHIRLEVTVPSDLVKRAQQKALKQLRAEANVPGFRKGKKVCYTLMG